MPETGTMNLSLKIAGNAYDDFYPYELTLKEGFSEVYRADLTVFTKTRREQKKIKELLEQKATITVSQRLAGGLISRQRYVHGIITGAASLGLVSRGGNADCYRHIITIESDLAKLRHTRLNCPYYRKTPPDMVEEILSRYEIQGEFADKHINRSSFCKSLMFDQVGVSDLDFMRHIMDLYGISFTFVHGKVPQGGLGTAELHFSEGSHFPQPFYEYSDKRKVPEIEHFDFMDYDEGRNIWKMDSWRMDSAIGIEGLEVSAPYPEADHGSQEWHWGSVDPGKRYYSYSSLFHDYKRGTPHDEIDEDTKRMIEARKLAFTWEKENWKGSTETIVPMPGLILELKHFQGPADSSAITALVTDTMLHLRGQWPRELVSPPAGADPGETAQVEFRVADWGKDSEKRFCRMESIEGKKWN